MAHLRIPVVDISPWTGGGTAQCRARVAAALDAACCTVGFVQVTGHGIAPPVLDGLAAAVDAVFALPPGTKDGYRTPPGVDRGYRAPHPGSPESFTVGTTAADHPGVDLPLPEHADNVWPAELPDFRPAVQSYVAEAARVARTLTTIVATALDLPADFFARASDHSLDVLRLRREVGEAVPHPRTASSATTTTGPHTDPGILTVLWADPVPGLQVAGVDGAWHEVVPVEGALLVNPGDLAARWTNGEYRSPRHRVVAPAVGDAPVRRRSAAFAHHGNVDAVVAAVPSCVPLGQRPAFPPTTVGDHLAARRSRARAGAPT